MKKLVLSLVSSAFLFVSVWSQSKVSDSFYQSTMSLLVESARQQNVASVSKTEFISQCGVDAKTNSQLYHLLSAVYDGSVAKENGQFSTKELQTAISYYKTTDGNLNLSVIENNEVAKKFPWKKFLEFLMDLIDIILPLLP